MSFQVHVIDETTPGAESARQPLEVESAKLTLRDIIRDRVRQEVEAYNENLPEIYHGLVQPDDSEKLLNGFRVKTRKPLDWQRQFETAARSFEQNGIFVLINGDPVESLDDEVELQPGAEIRFLRLVPLIGG